MSKKYKWLTVNFAVLAGMFISAAGALIDDNRNHCGHYGIGSIGFMLAIGILCLTESIWCVNRLNR